MKYIIAIALLCVATAHAGDEQGKIDDILINTSYPNIAFIVIGGANTGKPACATNPWEYVIDISNETGKALYSLALSSYIAQKNVYVSGANNCSLFGQSETVRYLHTKKQ